MKHAARTLAWVAALAAIGFLAVGGQPALAQDAPTVVKDTVQVQAWTINSFRGSFKVWSWVPQIKFRVNGPIASGDQLYVEFYQAGSKRPWVSFDCPTQETQPGYWWKTGECGGRDIPEDKGTTSPAPVSFAIKLRNELSGTNSTLYTGKVTLGKVHSGEAGPDYVNHFDFYVNQDWKIPIGYAYLAPGNGVPDFFPPRFFAVMWFKGENPVSIEAHLFYKGKEVAKDECDSTEELGTTHLSKVKWTEETCEFRYVYTVRTEHVAADAPIHELANNPGEYEIKILQKGRLARAMKFTVGEGGQPDLSLSAANQLGRKRGIAPVQVIGTQDGTWGKLDWKTGAFYGNPLTGFTAPP